MEAEDVLQFGAPPAVDGLVGVADGEDVVASFDELAQQDVLRQVRVLVLVDQDVREPFRPAFADVGHVVQQPDGGQEHIVEVEGIAGVQRALVHGGDAALELRVLAVAVVARVGHACIVFFRTLIWCSSGLGLVTRVSTSCSKMQSRISARRSAPSMMR